MKRSLQKLGLLLLLIIAFELNCKAQKFELSAGITTGASNITGSSAASNSVYYDNYYGENKYKTANIYGHKLAFSYGAYLRAQLVTPSGFIAGADGGYDVLRSKIDITARYDPCISCSVGTSSLIAGYSSPTPAKGSAILTNQFAQLSPYLGYRVKTRSISIDLTAGTEFGFALRSSQKIRIESPDRVSTTAVISKPPTDIRLRGGIAVNYKCIGLGVNYAHGIKSYVKNDPNLQYAPHGKAYSQAIRAGISYRIN